MWEPVENLDCSSALSHLPSDNDASLLAVNHYISVWGGHTTGQPSSQLLGTQQHGGHASRAHVPNKSGLRPMAIFAMSVEYSSAEEAASNTVCSIAWCWWSRTPTRYSSSVPNESLRSLINFLLFFGFSCTTLTLFRTIKMQILFQCKASIFNVAFSCSCSLRLFSSKQSTYPFENCNRVNWHL